MKISVVWSSPNLNGLTASAKNHFITGLKNAGAEIEEFHVNRMNIQKCLACGNGYGTCKTEGKCVLNDDFSKIYDSLVKADGIAFISAVYWHDITEQMRAFADRLRRCETAHNGFLKDKKCMLIACAGGTGRGVTHCLYNMEEYTNHMSMRVYDRIAVVRFNRDYIFPAIEKAGEAFIDRLEKGFDMYY